MVLCKFYLQGTCKFGSSCKFEHDQGHGNLKWTSPNYSSPLAGTVNKQTQGTTHLETGTLVESVINDMNGAEKGGQWLVSCYAPFKEKEAFPGFEDYSFEEDRYAFYEAKRTGMIEQYKQQWQSILQQAVMKVKALQNPSPEIVSMLRSLYDSPPKSPIINTVLQESGSIFGGNSSGSSNMFKTNTGGIFGGNQQQGSNFSQQSTSPSHAQNIFGQSQQRSVFGANQNSSNIFGVTSNPNSFSTSTQNSGSIFGKSTSGNVFSSQTSGIFNNQPNSTNSGLFSQNNPSSNIFAAQTTSVNKAMFPNQNAATQQNTENIFNRGFSSQNAMMPQTSGGLFSQQQIAVESQMNTDNSNRQQSVFGVKQNQGNAVQNFGIFTQQKSDEGFSNQSFARLPSASSSTVFGNSTQSINSSQGNNSPLNKGSSVFQQGNTGTFPFGQSSESGGSSIFGNSGHTVVTRNNSDLPVDEGTYSKLEDLTEAEIKWFESDELDIENIPLKPPTYQMCF